MVSRIFNKIKRILYSTYMCIRYPFLYPRNRFTGKHRVNLLYRSINKLHNQSRQEIGITGKLVKEKPKYLNKCHAFFNYQVKLDVENKTLKINNEIDSQLFDLKPLMWNDDRFEIVDSNVTFAIFGNPIIQVYLKPKDENDNTKYGFSYYRVKLTTNKRKYRWFKIIKWIDEKVLDRILFLPIFTEWDAVEPGWNKAFGKQYLKDLKKQLKKDKMLYKFRIVDLKEKYGCYDKETEVLTRNGWKLFSNVTMDDEFATLNSEHYLEYQKPSDIISYKYSGPMYHLENRGISLKVTPNHNLYVSKGSYFHARKNNLKVTYPFELCTPYKYFGKDKRFLKGCKWIGEIPPTHFKIPDYIYEQTYKDKRGYEVTRVYTKIGPIIEIEAFLKFLGFYIAEGHTYIRENKNGAYISIAYNPADEKELVTELIKNIGFNGSFSGRCARFSSTPLGHWLKENCGHLAPNKKVPEFVKNLSPKYIKIFLEYLYIGDGYQAKTSWRLTTTSKQLRDDVCELILKCGQAFSYCKIRPRPHYNHVTGQVINSPLVSYDINWMKNIEIEIDNSKSKHSKSFVERWEDYNDIVYCVTVPNHVIYIRRNGKGVWCGNSLRLYCNYGSPELYNIINKYENLSWNTCINCGKPATHTSKGWIAPYCEECVNNSKDPKRYIKRESEEETEHNNV